MLSDLYGKANRNILICNFDCEDYWPEIKPMGLPTVDLHNIKSIILNLDELFIFLGRKEDLLVLRKKPENDFINYLQSLGVEMPRILTVSSDDERKTISELILSDLELIKDLKEYVDENAKENIVTNLFPYGITKIEEDLSRHISAKLLSDSKTSELFNCKLTLKKMLSKFGILAPESHICDGINDLQNEGVKFVEQHGQVVLKEIYGSGGSGLARINDTVQFKKVIDYMRRLDQHEGNIIIEKWYATKISYNHQYIVRDGIIYQHAFSKQLISNNGKIRGSIFNQKTDYLLNVIDQHNTLSKPIAYEILKNGYQGLIGFDSVICADGSVFPVIDINCRINLSTIFYEILTRYFISNYACFFYKEYTLDAPMPFDVLRRKIEHSAYSSAKKEGIVVLNFTSLNVNILRSKGKTGRVFYAIFAKSEQRAKEIYEEIFLINEFFRG